MASQPESPKCYRNQNGFVCALVPSVHRAIDHHDPTRVLRPAAVLDHNRFGDETKRVQRLLQWSSYSCSAGRKDACRNPRFEGNTVHIVSMAKTLSRLIPDAHCRMN